METENQQTEYLSKIDIAKFFLISSCSHHYFYDIIKDSESIFDADKIIDDVKRDYCRVLLEIEMPIIDNNHFNEEYFSSFEETIKELESTTVQQIVRIIGDYYDIRLRLLYFKILLPFCKSQTLIDELNDNIVNLQNQINQRPFQKINAFTIYKTIINANPNFDTRFKSMLSDLLHVNEGNPTGIKKLISYFDLLYQEMLNNIGESSNNISDNSTFSIVVDDKKNTEMNFSRSEIYILTNFFHEVNVKLIPQNNALYQKHLIKDCLLVFTNFLNLVNSDEILNYSVKQYYSECQDKITNLESIIKENISNINFYDRFLFFNSLIDNLDTIGKEKFKHTSIMIGNSITDLISFINKNKKSIFFDINNYRISTPIIKLKNDNASEVLLKSCDINLKRSSLTFINQVRGLFIYYSSVSDDELFPQKNINTLQTNDDKFKDIPKKNINSFGFKAHSSFDLDKYYESILRKYGEYNNDIDKIKNASEIVQILKAENWDDVKAIKIGLKSKDFSYSLNMIYHIFDNMDPTTLSKSQMFKSKNNKPISAAQYYNAKSEIKNDFKNGISYSFFEDLIIYIKNCTKCANN